MVMIILRSRPEVLPNDMDYGPEWMDFCDMTIDRANQVLVVLRNKYQRLEFSTRKLN